MTVVQLESGLMKGYNIQYKLFTMSKIIQNQPKLKDTKAKV